MAGPSKIEWCTDTWNPVVGCSIVSPGCTNCYAMRMAARIEAMNPGGHYAGTTQASKAGAVWTGKIALAPEATLLQPLKWKKPRRIFVNSMGDLFHESIPDEWIDRVFAVMALCSQHTFQVLTKRAERMRAYLTTQHRHENIGDHMIEVGDIQPGFKRVMWPFPNVWLGVSCERQQEADERIPHLQRTPAAVRFISFEPLLGHIEPDLHGIHWAIVGGESGPNARPMHPVWARRILNVCAERGIAYFFKQWGAWQPHTPVPGGDLGGDVRAGRVRIVHPSARNDTEILNETGGQRQTERGSLYMERVGKKLAGRTLDGLEHSGFPEASA